MFRAIKKKFKYRILQFGCKPDWFLATLYVYPLVYGFHILLKNSVNNALLVSASIFLTFFLVWQGRDIRKIRLENIGVKFLHVIIKFLDSVAFVIGVVLVLGLFSLLVEDKITNDEIIRQIGQWMILSILVIKIVSIILDEIKNRFFMKKKSAVKI